MAQEVNMLKFVKRPELADADLGLRTLNNGEPSVLERNKGLVVEPSTTNVVLVEESKRDRLIARELPKEKKRSRATSNRLIVATNKRQNIGAIAHRPGQKNVALTFSMNPLVLEDEVELSKDDTMDSTNDDASIDNVVGDDEKIYLRKLSDKEFDEKCQANFAQHFGLVRALRFRWEHEARMRRSSQKMLERCDAALNEKQRELSLLKQDLDSVNQLHDCDKKFTMKYKKIAFGLQKDAEKGAEAVRRLGEVSVEHQNAVNCLQARIDQLSVECAEKDSLLRDNALEVSNLKAHLDKLSEDRKLDKDRYDSKERDVKLLAEDRRWLIKDGFKLIVGKLCRSEEFSSLFGECLALAARDGMHVGLKIGFEHAKKGKALEQATGSYPRAESFENAVNRLWNVSFPYLDLVAACADKPLEVLKSINPVGMGDLEEETSQDGGSSLPHPKDPVSTQDVGQAAVGNPEDASWCFSLCGSP